MTYGTVNADVIGTSVAGSNMGAGNASLMKNRIINGAMVIDQRNAGASTTPTADSIYSLDRWKSRLSVSSKYSVQQNAGSVTPPVGFSNYLGVTSLSSYSVGASEFFSINQQVEGYNWNDLNWGTANAKTITLSFWVRSSLTGTFGGSMSSGVDFNYSYPFSYTIPTANTWTQISVTVVGPTSGNWTATNGAAIELWFALGVGSTYSGTAGAWVVGGKISATGATSVVGTNGATFYITGVQLEVGSSATGFEYVNYQTSLANCQRYYEQVTYDLGGAMTTGQAITTSRALANLGWTVQKRTAATISYSGDIYVWRADANSYPVGTVTFSDASVNNVRIDCTGITASPLVAGNAAMIYPSTEVILKASAEL